MMLETVTVSFASGSVAEWSKALVLGTSNFDCVGSNPTAARFFFYVFFP